ncbi:MAG: helix-turn-helix domain-containing protein [Gammaproteobacteria bacterium]|nr:helix-turn-helix domain-containing protein [Gammaproteobacteria bacterium]
MSPTTPQVEIEPAFYTAQDVQRLIGISRPTLNRWFQTGQIPKPQRLGTQRLVWPRSVIDDWMATLPQA